MSDQKQFKTLFKTDQLKNVRQWKIWCNRYTNHSIYTQEYGRVDGKLQQTHTKIGAGKNIGKVNETSHWDQCISEATSLWTKKRDRNGYAEKNVQPTAVVRPRPMLAKSYNMAGSDLSVLKDGGKIKFPCYVQPKLDGVKCLCTITPEGCELRSRQNKQWHILKHIQLAINKLQLPIGTTLDGELYIHGESFQNLTSAIKRDKPSKNTDKIEYHIYDMVAEEGYAQRHTKLAALITTGDSLKLVLTSVVADHQAVEFFHSYYISKGYEGIMLRNKLGRYKDGGRSVDLQKVKKFIDEEFKIVDAYQNKGRQVKQCTFVCETKDGTKFGVKPEGTEQQREQYWIDWQDGRLKNCLLTVRFFSWTTSTKPVPRFPVGVAIRGQYE